MENVLISKSIRSLHTLTREYHATHDSFMKAWENKDHELMASEIKKIQVIEGKIKTNLSIKLEAVEVNGKYMLTTKSNKSVKLIPVVGGGLLKFRMELVELENGTKFETLEAANEQRDPAEAAAFRSYINGVGSNQKQA